MPDEPIYVEDINTPEYIRRRGWMKIMFVLMVAAAILYIFLLASTITGHTDRPSTLGPTLSLAGATASLSMAWAVLTKPFRIYGDRLEYLDHVIPVARMTRITRVEEDGFVKFWIKARGWWPRFFLPFYFKCDPGSPKCAAFDALKNEVESARRFPPVTTSSSTRTL